MNTTWTGERLEKYITHEPMLEHLHRYAAALPFIKGKVVLDIACGEGYGCNLLTQEASKVIGIDIDVTCIKNAKLSYKNPQIEFLSGSILDIPLTSNCVDIITCFETLEHITEHENAITELKRVLKPDGILIISTPDKKNYSDDTGYHNPFHKKELYEYEFKTLINNHFKNTFFLSQQSVSASILLPINVEKTNLISGTYDKITSKPFITPTYHIAWASNKTFIEPEASLFYTNKNLTAQLAIQEIRLKKTLTYRLGNIILAPFKWIHSLINR